MNGLCKINKSGQVLETLGGLYTNRLSEGRFMSEQLTLFADLLQQQTQPKIGRNRLSIRDDLTGQEFGRLTVLCRAENIGRHRGWECVCSCGGKIIASTAGLRNPAGTKSCGCLRKEIAQKRIGPAWNKGKKYVIPAANGERVYKTKHSWAFAVIRLKGNKCEKCGWCKAQCDVHHIKQRSEGGQNVLSNAIVICPNCHREAHQSMVKMYAGENHNRAKLTEDDVRAIRASDEQYKVLAKRYGVSGPAISAIRRGLAWKHVV